LVKTADLVTPEAVEKPIDMGLPLIDWFIFADKLG
jgi:hypothetical protein